MKKLKKKLKIIHLRYENDRPTIPPYFWRVVVDGRDIIPDKHTPRPNSPYTTEKNAEDMVIDLLTKAGVEDTTNLDQWHEAGYDFKKDSIEGFGNWAYRSE